ncbi:ATPase-activating ribosome biosynthesis protein [Aspergillus melleus]|uniref:ATPase-activating ribosome biosynthesis protein n=1 Tax=Aspergillus melleus TaxID=138277 RepID=A0ACC3BFW5_9EURO|nr:ATPase-activating ribosome biosynthesis protein [Aspergillus melleus]KAH8422515.1 ATPase-activating ribosome biosynthesis protein [Aspergillus melleus]KAK1149625.1 ATPase-activating ribosome biosynthesis protein [Aspergillus melleus]
MRIENCFFCSRPTYPSKGITFVRNDAKAFRFCRSKCQRAFTKKRQARKVKWTKISRQHAGKEMQVDRTLQFAARRNVPTRYNRQLMAQTLHAMERVEEIRARRERVFYKKRMAGNRERETAENFKLVSENEHLLPRELRENADAKVADVEPAKTKVFKTERRKLRARVDGGVEEVVEGMDMD